MNTTYVPKNKHALLLLLIMPIYEQTQDRITYYKIYNVKKCRDVDKTETNE